MKHFLLKFNAGVEIGARLAYLGHYRRVNLIKVYDIALDELLHRSELIHILEDLGEKPDPRIDGFFRFVGNIIQWMCGFMPLWSLDLVARTMELFAISNYGKLAVKYPKYASRLNLMEAAEKDHEEYFRLGPVRYENLRNLRAALIGGRSGIR